MTTTEVPGNATGDTSVGRVDMKLETSGPDPQRRTYASFVSFSDPDGNDWYAAYMVAEQTGEELPS